MFTKEKIMDKNLLFEYLVFRLDEWKKDIEKRNEKVPAFTKLRLQKILFLVCAWNVENTNRKLLNIFNQFYALPYGPVEIDIYDAMKNNKIFQHISFNGNECIYSKFEPSVFISISSKSRKWIDEAVDNFIKNDRKYLTMPVFDLVELTHKWTVWQIYISTEKQGHYLNQCTINALKAIGCCVYSNHKNHAHILHHDGEREGYGPINPE